MKKLFCMLMCSVLLCGCSSQKAVETVTDEFLLSVASPQKELTVKLPNDAAKNVFAAEDGAQMYFCDGYVLTLQTLSSGDLDRSVRELCGYGAEKLTILQTKLGDVKRYDWTWTSAGEGGVQVGRAAVLDDGDYHYCMTAMATEVACGSLDGQWESLFASLGLKY